MPKKKRSKSKSPDVTRDRVNLVRDRIAAWKTDALLITNPRDIHYLTGFSGEDSWAIVHGGTSRVTILSDNRFDEQIDREAPKAQKVIRKGSLVEVLHKNFERRKYARLAVQAGYVTLHQRKELVKALGAKAIVPVDDGLLSQRAIKSPDEVAKIRQAGRIQIEAFGQMLRYAKPGMSEREVCGYLEFEMAKRGAEGPAFPTIVAADANSALPHAVPGAKKLRKGGMLLVDWGACYQGYRSDMTRVIAFGRWPKKIREIHPIVHEAQLTAIDMLGPGVSLSSVDKAARDVIKRAGYGKYFQHGLGHGIGLNIHEQPNFGARSKGALMPGHVVTVEPGIYLRGIGGVRIEDDILITERGKRVLTDDLPAEADSCII